jgi:hypothetical protein
LPEKIAVNRKNKKTFVLPEGKNSWKLRKIKEREK